jgi:type I restriction enzyme S subunit
VGEWPLRALGELVDNFDGRRIPVKESDRRPGPYPYYGASGVVDHVDGYLFDGEYLLVAEDGENLRTRRTPVAFLASGRFWVNNHAHVLKANSNADTRFLNYALSTTDIGGYITGSTMPKLTQGNLHRIPVVAPPLAQQCRIAAILAALDDKIALNRRTSETLQMTARALFKSWFVAEARTGAAGWRSCTIGDLAEVVGGSTPSTAEPRFWNGNHYWATPKDLAGLRTPVLLSTERTLTDAGLGQISSGLLPAGTVLMSSRAPIGYLAITEVPVAINQGFIAMKPRPGVSGLFLLHWAASSQNQILSRANGSTFLEISKSSFRPIEVHAPPADAMASFDRVVRPIHERVVANERQIGVLAEIRDALLPRLLSGQLTP